MGFGNKGRGWGGCGCGGSRRGSNQGSSNNKNNDTKNQKIKFQPFQDGKVKMTFEQVKQHVLSFIKRTYTNDSDI